MANNQHSHPAVAAAVWVCAICWLPCKVRIAALLCRMIMVMATVRKVAPTNSAFLCMHELKTEPQEKFLFPHSLVSNSETANEDKMSDADESARRSE